VVDLGNEAVAQEVETEVDAFEREVAVAVA
jgi:hypothetical protein